MNPLLKNMGGFNPQAMLIQEIMNRNPNLRNIYSMLQNGGNPQQIMQTMVNNNPQVKQLLSNMSRSGMNAEQYVRSLAQQYNIDIEPMIDSLKKRGYK